MRGKLKQPPMPAGSGGVRMRAHLGSLRARLVLYVFCIMTMASLFTSAAYVVMLSAGWLRPLFITQMMSPISPRPSSMGSCTLKSPLATRLVAAITCVTGLR